MSRTVRNRDHWVRFWDSAGYRWPAEGKEYVLTADHCCRSECCSPKAMRRAGYLPHRDRRRLAE